MFQILKPIGLNIRGRHFNTSKNNKDTFEAIPRDSPWAPKTDYEKYVSPGKGVDFCHMNAFEVEEAAGKKRTTVKHLNACMLFCRGYEDICLAGAITPPPEEKTHTFIDQLKQNVSVGE